jgi:hypothetical protein
MSEESLTTRKVTVGGIELDPGPAGTRLDLQDSAMMGDDSVRERESQAGPLHLGGEEGVQWRPIENLIGAQTATASLDGRS